MPLQQLPAWEGFLQKALQDWEHDECIGDLDRLRLVWDDFLEKVLTGKHILDKLMPVEKWMRPYKNQNERGTLL